MKINFTKHAKLRCMQRKIPEQWVEELLNKVPLSLGDHEQLLDGTNLTVVFRDGDINRTVITLYAKEVSKAALNRKSKKLAKQPHVKDIVNKEIKKRDRRAKQSKKHKFKIKRH